MSPAPSGFAMEAAIAMASAALESGNYPVGAVVERSGEIVSRAFTELHTRHDPTAHAEVLAIRRAAESLASGRLRGCTLYTTLEPCPMCTSAAIWARMEGIVFGATQADAVGRARSGNSEKHSWRQIDLRCRQVVDRGTPLLTVHEGFLRTECTALLTLA